MNVQHRIAGAAFVAILIAVLAAAGYWVTQLVDAQQTAPELTASPLLITNRDRLSLCVDGADGFTASSEDVDSVRTALDAGLGKQLQIPNEYTKRVVTAGCPPPSARLGTPEDYIGLNATRYYPGDGSPSEHLLFIYFVSRDVYTASFGTQPYAYVPEEFICEGDVCWVVTYGLYFPESVTPDVLEATLVDRLVLPRPNNPEPVLDWSACERGEQPYPDNTCDQYEEWLD